MHARVSSVVIACALASLATTAQAQPPSVGIEGGTGERAPEAPAEEPPADQETPVGEETPAPVEEPPTVPASPQAEPEPRESEPAREDPPRPHAHVHAHPHAHTHAHSDEEEGGLGVTASVAPRRERSPTRSAISDIEIEPGLLSEVPRRSAEDLLTLAPGVLVSNHGGEGHAPTIFLRGFDAGEGQDIEILVDGIPINEPSNAHGHGYADTRFVMPELVRSLRVMQGPFDPSQGDFAIAGSVEYRLGAARRGVLVRGEYGRYDTRRLHLSWAPERMNEGTFVGVEIRDGAGFGPNRAHFGAGALGRFEHRASREVSLFVLGATQIAENDSAGVVRQDASRSCGDVDPLFCVTDSNQGASAARHLLAAGLIWQRPGERFEQSIWGSIRNLRVRENFTGRFVDERGDGLDEQYDANTVGMRGSYRMRIPWEGRDHGFELGYFARHDTGDTRSHRVDFDDGTPYRSLFDAGFHVTDIGAWIGGELSPIDALTIRAGLRADALHYAVVDRALAEMDREGERLPTEAHDAFGISLQPRGTVRVRLIDELDWITSIGVGTRSSDAIALSDGERAPFARAISSETGLGLALREERSYSVRANAGLFHAYVDRDLLFDQTRGRNVPVGASNRYGAFLYLRVQVEDWLDAGTSFAWTEAHLPPEGADFFDLGAGDRLPFVPRFTGRVDIAARKTFEIDREPFMLAGGVGVSWVGPRPLPNGAEGDAYAVTDVSASVGWRFVELGISIQNLFDVRYERASYQYVSRFDLDRPASMVPARHYAAGPPILAMATLTLRLEPLRWLSGARDEEGETE